MDTMILYHIVKETFKCTKLLLILTHNCSSADSVVFGTVPPPPPLFHRDDLGNKPSTQSAQEWQNYSWNRDWLQKTSKHAPSPGDCWPEGKGRRVFNSGVHTKVRGARWVWGGRQRGRSYPVQVNGAAVVPALLTVGFPWRLRHLLVVQPQHCHHLICTNTTHRYWVIQRFHHLQWMWIVHGCVWCDDCYGSVGWNVGMDGLWLIFGGGWGVRMYHCTAKGAVSN